VPEGFIDVLSDTEVIEVKAFDDWKHALGQVLVYAANYPGYGMRLHLFDTAGRDLAMVARHCARFGVTLSVALVSSRPSRCGHQAEPHM
jgi:hypothetical protein